MAVGNLQPARWRFRPRPRTCFPALRALRPPRPRSSRFAIDGKAYLKATASGAATPTTDSAGGTLVLSLPLTERSSSGV